MSESKQLNELCKYLYAKNDIANKIFQNFIQLEFKFDSVKTKSDKSILIHDYLKCLNELNSFVIRQSIERFNETYNKNNADIELIHISIGCSLIIIFLEKYLYINKKIQSIYKELNIDSKLIILAYEEKRSMYKKYKEIYVNLECN